MPEFMSQNPCEKPGVVANASNPSTGETGSSWSPVAANLGKTVDLGSVRDLISKNKSDGTLGTATKIVLWPVHVHTNTHEHTKVFQQAILDSRSKDKTQG